MNGCIHGGMTGWVKLLRWRRTKRVCLFVCLLLILLGFFFIFFYQSLCNIFLLFSYSYNLQGCHIVAKLADVNKTYDWVKLVYDNYDSLTTKATFKMTDEEVLAWVYVLNCIFLLFMF